MQNEDSGEVDNNSFLLRYKNYFEVDDYFLLLLARIFSAEQTF
jgi:hypothetical protein